MHNTSVPQQARPEWSSWRWLVVRFVACALALPAAVAGEDAARREWTYRTELLRPFWQGSTVVGESVLFIRDPQKGDEPPRASVLFPIESVLSVRDSAGETLYEEGRDYVWDRGSRQLALPAGSRIPSRTPQDLRRPAGSQKYQLTHRDGGGEILFGERLEYHAMQVCVSYRHSDAPWKVTLPRYDGKALPRSVSRLLHRQPLSIVVLGDSISAGANASGLYDAAPYQPAYPELLRRHLHERFQGKVELTNLAVGGTDTKWGVSQIDKVVEAQPHLVILAFGMNDSAGRPADEYLAFTKEMLAGIREQLPESEFILVASMLGNRDWTRLQPELFPAYRDALRSLVEPGIALADLTSIWSEFLELKQDWDQTGNGVNHPNDFGHRVYAQALATLLTPDGARATRDEPVQTVVAGPLTFHEQRLLGGYTYSYACAAADLDGDGDLDLTSADAEPHSNLYLLRNDGGGRFLHSHIQKYGLEDDQPVRLERHAVGDVNGDGRPDVVIVDNLQWDIRWFENPGPEAIAQPWPLRRVAAAREVPGSYDVALADLDADGDLDVAASSWRFGNRFDWFENVGAPGNASEWRRHLVAEGLSETRTIAVGDFNRDGRPDLLGTARTGHQVLWYANAARPGGLKWDRHAIDGETLAPAHGHPVDMDGDGDLDVLMAFGIVAPVANDSPMSHQIAWYENVGQPGSGTSWKKHLVAAGFPQGFEAVAGDLDADGDLDVVATGWSPEGRIAWFENQGDPRGQWRAHPLKSDWPNAVTVILADLDHDDRLDIVACAERGANELRWWRNAGR